MRTKNLKLTSVRLDPDTLDAVEKFVKNHDYWTKNKVINNILTTVFERFKDKDIYDMCRTWDGTKNPITAIYRIEDLPSPKEP